MLVFIQVVEGQVIIFSVNNLVVDVEIFVHNPVVRTRHFENTAKKVKHYSLLVMLKFRTNAHIQFMQNHLVVKINFCQRLQATANCVYIYSPILFFIL